MSCNAYTYESLPRTMHWTIRPGTSAMDFTFQVLESDGTAVDISAYDFELIISRPNGQEILTLGMGDGITLISTVKGRATLDSTDSAALPQDIDLRWQFNMVTDTAEEYDLLAGVLQVTARTTACVRVPDSTDFTFTAVPLTFNFEIVRSTDGPYSVTINIEDGDTYNMPAGRLLMAIAIDPDDEDRTLSIGYSSGATQVLDNEEIPADSAYSATVNRYFHSATTLHFSGDAATVKLYIF